MSEQLTFQLQFCNFFPHLSEVARDSGRSETGISLTSSNHQDQRIWVDDWAVENAAGLLKGRNGEAETENQELRNAATSEEPRTVADMKRQELHSANAARNQVILLKRGDNFEAENGEIRANLAEEDQRSSNIQNRRVTETIKRNSEILKTEFANLRKEKQNLRKVLSDEPDRSGTPLKVVTNQMEVSRDRLTDSEEEKVFEIGELWTKIDALQVVTSEMNEKLKELQFPDVSRPIREKELPSKPRFAPSEDRRSTMAVPKPSNEAQAEVFSETAIVLCEDKPVKEHSIRTKKTSPTTTQVHEEKEKSGVNTHQGKIRNDKEPPTDNTESTHIKSTGTMDKRLKEKGTGTPCITTSAGRPLNSLTVGKTTNKKPNSSENEKSEKNGVSSAVVEENLADVVDATSADLTVETLSTVVDETSDDQDDHCVSRTHARLLSCLIASLDNGKSKTFLSVADLRGRNGPVPFGSGDDRVQKSLIPIGTDRDESNNKKVLGCARDSQHNSHASESELSDILVK
jgi:hypothetical protein